MAMPGPPRDLPADFWSDPDLRAAIEQRHMGRLVRAYRLHSHHGRRGLPQQRMAEWAGITQAQLSRIESGPPVVHLDRLIEWARLLGIPNEILWFSMPGPLLPLPAPAAEDDELAALELVRRVTASDVSNETLTQLELVVDDLAVAYPVTPPADLLARIRRYLGYVENLIDGRMTLQERQRLTVVGGWLSLLAATVHIDLEQVGPATARLRAAAQLARHAGHREIEAWTFETDAWRVLTVGDYRLAVDLSRAAQAIAPAGSSVAIQATAQEGRAWARLGEPQETYDAVDRVHHLVAPMKPSDRPEHHYRYDPEKSVAYVATTLAWLGDPAAETYAREILNRLATFGQASNGKWPRRMASANLDLALSLLLTGKHDEACDAALRGIASGRVAPSNHWRAAEVVKAVEARQVPGAADLREAYQHLVSSSGVARS
jgi:transcriptional regulator with XRE-family HTH domain